MSASKIYILALLTFSYIAAELGHFIIGTTTKSIAEDLHYGDISCQQNNTDFKRHELTQQCATIDNEEECHGSYHNGTSYCEWNYNGLGFEYQILAGPAYMFVFTVMGVIVGFAADRFNRVNILSFCIFLVGIALVLQGMVKEYWQLLLLRMVLAAGASGCTPLATGIISDIFPVSRRAFAIAIFNWGIYGGSGLSFPIGRGIPKMNIFDLGWRVCYYGTGIIVLIFATLIKSTMTESERPTNSAELRANSNKKSQTSWSLLKVLLEPRFLLLIVCASIRHCAGLTFAYNADLYFLNYFPDASVGWAIFFITIISCCFGVTAGGWISDKLVIKYGIKSRMLCLAASQLCATLPALGVMNFEPTFALICLAITNCLSEMWFGIFFAVLVEIVPPQITSTSVGVMLFFMNNIGGNLPILVDPVSKAIGYRESIEIFYAGAYAISAILFFFSMFFIKPYVEEGVDEADNGKAENINHDLVMRPRIENTTSTADC